MAPKVKYGLITGAVGALIDICVSCCGPIISIITGAVAGYLTVRAEVPATKGAGAKSGAVSGAISGAIGLVGQLIGSVVSYYAVIPFLRQNLGSSFSFTGDIVTTAVFTCCLGFVGVGLAAGAGALAGMLATPSTTATR